MRIAPPAVNHRSVAASLISKTRLYILLILVQLTLNRQQLVWLKYWYVFLFSYTVFKEI